MERMIVDEDQEIGKKISVSQPSEIVDEYDDTLTDSEFETDMKG